MTPSGGRRAGSSPGLGPEDRLVLLLAPGVLDPERARRARKLLDRPLAWPGILVQARAHGVTPGLHRALTDLGHPGVPPEARAALQAAQRTRAAKNLLAARQLAAVLDALGRAGIVAIPLKGVALAEALYGDPAARAVSDLDVLVPRRDVARAFEVLLGRGYQHGEDVAVGPAEIEALLDSNMEYSFLPPEPDGLLRLELHWDVAWRWRGDGAALADLWGAARPGTYRGAPAFTMSPEWRVLYLCVHAARHRWGRLKWLVDVHELCRRGDVDWGRVAERAAAFGWSEVVRLTLCACRDLLESPVPPALAAGRLPGWVRLYPRAEDVSGGWGASLVPLRLLPGLGDKAGYLGRLVLRPTIADRRLVSLPRGLGFLYYPLRVVRLGARWARGAA